MLSMALGGTAPLIEDMADGIESVGGMGGTGGTDDVPGIVVVEVVPSCTLVIITEWGCDCK
jgi:hypothetical protein